MNSSMALNHRISVMKAKSCAVAGCDSNYCTDGSETRRFRFPRDEMRCRLWVERCRNKALLSWSAEALYGTKRICGKHFAPHAFVNALQQRLVHDAVPSIFQFNAEGSDLNEEPMIWCPEKSTIPKINKRNNLVVGNILPEASIESNANLLDVRFPQSTCLNPIDQKPKSNNNEQELHMKKQPITSKDSFKIKLPQPSSSFNNETTENINRQQLSVSEKSNNPLLLTPSTVSEHDSSRLVDLEPNILEKHMELFRQSEGKEFLIVGEVCMITEKDPNQMCGSAKCNDDLFNSKRAEKLVRCWSRCKKWFHLRCTDLTPEEYHVLSNKESLRWLCEECCKDDIF